MWDAFSAASAVRSSFWITGFLLLTVVNATTTLVAQTPEGQAAANRQSIEQLIEQNRKLEQQNQELMQQNRQLMEQIKTLLPSVAKQDGTDQLTPTQASSPTSQSGAPPNIQKPTNETVDLPDKPDQDDKSLLPEASNGNSAIFGEFNPGRGFTVAKGEDGELNLSGYMAVRYLNQLPPSQTADDHLGRPIAIQPRNDFQFHRVMLFSQGWLFSPKFQYSTFVWTVQDTNQVAVGGALYYNFGKYLTIGAGWNAYPGTMSLQGSHPYWVSYDRVMADEFFRPYFSRIRPRESDSDTSVQMDGWE